VRGGLDSAVSWIPRSSKRPRFAGGVSSSIDSPSPGCGTNTSRPSFVLPNAGGSRRYNASPIAVDTWMTNLTPQPLSRLPAPGCWRRALRYLRHDSDHWWVLPNPTLRGSAAVREYLCDYQVSFMTTAGFSSGRFIAQHWSQRRNLGP